MVPQNGAWSGMNMGVDLHTQTHRLLTRLANHSEIGS
jgi:hypothetical protein